MENVSKSREAVFVIYRTGLDGRGHFYNVLIFLRRNVPYINIGNYKILSLRYKDFNFYQNSTDIEYTFILKNN